MARKRRFAVNTDRFWYDVTTRNGTYMFSGDSPEDALAKFRESGIKEEPIDIRVKRRR